MPECWGSPAPPTPRSLHGKGLQLALGLQGGGVEREVAAVARRSSKFQSVTIFDVLDPQGLGFKV